MICEKCGLRTLEKFPGGLCRKCFGKTAPGKQMARAEQRYQKRVIGRRQLANRSMG